MNSSWPTFKKCLNSSWKYTGVPLHDEYADDDWVSFIRNPYVYFTRYFFKFLLHQMMSNLLSCFENGIFGWTISSNFLCYFT